MTGVDIEDVHAAAEQFDDDIVERTPVDRSRSLGEMADAEVFLKMEHLQRTGSFKTRGASNKMASLRAADSVVERVVAASAGNHAQGVALAASAANLDATIVMPQDAPQAKIDATREYGAEVVLHGRDFRTAMDHAESLAEADRTEFVHAYDDPDIVAGQATVGLEILEDVSEVDTVIVPIGGGGLIGGVGVALKALRPDVRLVGVQAESAATVPRSLEKGEPHTEDEVDTIADGIATGGIASLTLDLIDSHVDEVVTVSDGTIARGIILLMERAKQVVEGAGAAAVAPLVTDAIDVSGETVVPVLSGGNIDVSMLQTVLTHELTERNRLLQLRVLIDDQPGVLEEISGVASDHGANIRTVHHYRANADLDVGEAYITFEMETSGTEHAETIKRTIRDRGYEITQVN
ncbi:threonine ammonia-lyase [Halomicrococcus sp. SG-WS-1]|uniref:threonine ammonia-lyase n=1 Tax=Halomicrococcus sp. SG-WS-1 TaxID=3439057 RepID=UPI003F796ED0